MANSQTINKALEQPQQDDAVVGTKTWFEDGKLMQQELKHSDVYKQPQQEQRHE